MSTKILDDVETAVAALRAASMLDSLAEGFRLMAEGAVLGGAGYEAGGRRELLTALDGFFDLFDRTAAPVLASEVARVKTSEVAAAIGAAPTVPPAASN